MFRRLSRSAVTTVVLSALFVPIASARPDVPIADPLPTPGASGIGLELTEVARLPKSEPVPPPTDARLRRHNRINHLGEVPDGSGRLFVPDMNGRLYLLAGGAQLVYLDLGAVVGPDFHTHRGLGSGFGFVAFHPDFRDNGRFYTVHTETGSALTGRKPDLPSPPDAQVHGVITEWTAADPGSDAFSGTRREVLRVGFASFIHGFQEIGFNPTARRWHEDHGLLYIASGDGGIGASTTVPQDLASPQGKILRIDPGGRDGVNGQYGIPRSNPFVDRAGALGEIYAYGMRDPYRFSWDAGGAHKMFLGHIGEKAVDSVYEVRKGANLGWSEREGNWEYRRGDPSCGVFPLPADDAKYGYTYPVTAFDHNRLPSSPPCADSGNALIGGFVYRGTKIPSLRGKYIYGEGVKGLIYYADEHEMRAGRPMAVSRELMVYADGRLTTLKALVDDPSRVDLRFGQDAGGELHVLAKANGKVWKVTGARTFASCRTGHDLVSGAGSARSWDPVTPELWRFPGREVVLARPGTARPGPRRPFEYAILTKGPAFGSVQVDASVRLDTPVAEANRDVVVVFGYRSDTEFYYAHLSSDNKIYPHNGIFVVDNADRLRLDHQWDAARSVGAAPAVSDLAWHRVRVRHCAGSGEIAVYVDGSPHPLMTAVDTTFASGRVGFGSFDNIGRLRDLRVRGEGVR
ncbi:Glucose/arabinose dehydrogenase, beta-propeller fold [Lentzea xinjiangensis]|uniref:Glucose/arabinose dehydrogenase, beta-propeller fold n=1 Tax=Lentzea xinjiangensis TaxID=402600 RepID=A0A1H9M5B1_9PSEU|nr:PQQ-dependent sugar dehydrogenase [Lentzea xinjiangensis]SER18721.1 Glucose/arabinose dehydrogenase, beta-propeller fold [Lentzea xinjiangensis]